jgi:hypothetical protein
MAVYRYKGMVWLLPFFAGIPLVVMVSGLFTLRGADVAGHVIVPLICWVIAIVEWLIVVVTAVRVRPDGLVIDNVLVRHVIPWERFAGLFVEEGEGMFARLDDGQIVKSSGFGRSLSDAMKGYAHMRDTLGRIQADCRQARGAHAEVSPPPPYRRQLNIPWAPALAFLAFFEAISWIAFAAHGG